MWYNYQHKLPWELPKLPPIVLRLIALGAAPPLASADGERQRQQQEEHMTRRRAIVACHKRLFSQQRGRLHQSGEKERRAGAKQLTDLTLTC